MLMPGQGKSVFRPAGSKRRPSASVSSVALRPAPQVTSTDAAMLVWTLNGLVVAAVRPLLVTWRV